MHTVASITEALKQIKDPELNCDIVELGLIYAIRILNSNHIEIDATLTSIGCPAGPYILSEIKRVVEKLANTPPQCTVNLVWEPAWTKEKIDPIVREELMGN